MDAQKAQTIMEALRADVLDFLQEAKRPYYVLYRDSTPTAPGKRTDWMEAASSDDAWARIENSIVRWLANGSRSFMVEVSRGGKHDGTGKAQFPANFAEQKALAATAGLAGIFGISMPAPYASQVPIGYVPSSELKNLEERMMERFDHKEALRERDEEIAFLKETKKDPLEKFFDRIEGLLDRLPEPVQNTIAMGLMAKLTGSQQVSAAVGQVPAAPAKGGKLTRQSGPGEVPAAEPENDGPDIEADNEFANRAIQLLWENGFETPGQTMFEMAQFYIANRPMVDGIIAGYKAQNQAAQQ